VQRWENFIPIGGGETRASSRLHEVQGGFSSG
jgi:hypothetical protein